MTHLAGHPDMVSDENWAEAAEHYDEPGLSALVSMAALTNFFNRVNTPSGSSLTPGGSQISQNTVPTR
jgi:alkylhydroperoxidase family enzyme